MRQFFFLLVLMGQAGLSFANAQEKSRTYPPPLPYPESRWGTDLLSSDDRYLYEQIFNLQDGGFWKEADILVGRLENKFLLGHILYQRYILDTSYRTGWLELRNWLRNYSDHPGAWNIYYLAKRRRPHNAKMPPSPNKRVYRNTGGIARPLVQRVPLFQTRESKKVRNEVRKLIQIERPSQALRYILRPEQDRHLKAAETDLLKSWIARSYFIEHKPELSYKISLQASRSQKEIPEINWYAGLAAWRIGEYEKAAEHFTRLSKAAFSENDERAAGAFWAARCHIILGNDKKAVQFLNFARDQGLHFYAMLAERRLYGPIQISWIFSGGNGEEIEKLRNHKAVQRARALNQIGRGEMGEGELLTLHGRLSSQLDSALISLAESEGFAALQIAVADEIRHDLTTGIMAVPAGLFPVPSYEPESGFTLDQALLLALIRQESGFKRRAKSSAGARGLMQLMPTTAAFISKDKSLRRRTGRDKLYRDELNLDLGQEYLEIMLKNETAKNNLVFALGAYNAGPGNMRRWFKDVQFDGDPLLFLESLPVRETRHYLANVLTNLWAYRKRLGQDTPSLDALAAGLWPLYLSLDKNNGIKAEDKQAHATKPR